MRMVLRQYGLEDLYLKLETIATDSGAIARQCLFEGAKVVADELRQTVETIPTEEHHAVPAARNGIQLAYLTPEEKAACLNGIGVARHEERGDAYTTAVSFNGYMDEDADDRLTTKRYPHGIPVAVIMRSLEIGSSVRKKYPVCRKAFNKAKPLALAAMQKKLDERINKMK